MLFLMLKYIALRKYIYIFFVETNLFYREKLYEGILQIETVYETLFIPIKYQAIEGSLNLLPSSIIEFPPIFPGNIYRFPLIMKSTYR